MIKNITINNTNAFKSKNAKISFKKYIKNLCDIETEKKIIAETIQNHIDDMQKFFNDNFNVKFQIEKIVDGFDIKFTLTKLTPKDINKIKLRNKLKKIDNEKNYLYNKKIAKKKFDIENNELKSDDRVNELMIKLYYKVKYDFPESSNIPTPLEILNDLDKFKESFENYVSVAETKNELEKYVLLKNNYCNYMSFMTGINIIIPEDLEQRYLTNNLKI